MVILKLDFKDEKMILYLSKPNLMGFDVMNKKSLEQYFKELFLKLQKRYNIKMDGYYYIDVYKDANYGMILEIEKDDLDYYNYFSQIDMKINVLKNSSFLYEIDYELISDDMRDIGTFYQNGGRIYLHINKEISFIKLGKIIEKAHIIYGEDKNQIMHCGKKVHL